MPSTSERGGICGSGGDDGADADDAVRADAGAVHHDGRMPIMTLSSTMAPWTIAECATVTPSPRTHGKPGSECRTQPSWMLVPFADSDGFGVAADDRVEPDAGVFADGDVAQNVDAGCDENRLVDEFGPKGEDSTHRSLAPAEWRPSVRLAG